jgi:acetyl-CoA carboxylase/biotin carboxylase 1
MAIPNGSAPVNGHDSSSADKYNLPSHFIGGNHLDVAPPSSVKDFVANHGGHSVITSVSLS